MVIAVLSHFCYTQYVIYIHPRIRIGIILIISFLVSGFLMNYSQEVSSTQAPQIQIETIGVDFSKSLSEAGVNIMSSLGSFKIPSLFSFVPSSSNTFQSPSQEPIEAPTETPQDWDTLPTDTPEIPTSTPAQLPTESPETPIEPTTTQPKPTIKKRPTAVPTKIPKPTSKPKPSPTKAVAPVTTDIRPGSSLDEIIQEVSKRTCVPTALLKAFREQEAGAWFQGDIKIYNTYGWWKDASRSTVCAGLAYYTQSGLIPAQDSPGAYAESEDKTCTSAPIGNQSYDQKIMGIFQISQSEQDGVKNQIAPILPGPYDRRVLFDNMIIFATITKNRAGSNPHSSCDDWPQETVSEVARIHHAGSNGVCKYAYSGGKSGDYCKEIWDLYRSFK